MHYLQSFLIRLFNLTALLVSLTPALFSQNADSLFISSLYKEALKDSTSYKLLGQLVNDMPGRLCGSKASLDAVNWSAEKMKELGADTVYFQEIKVRNWKRGKKETATLMISGKNKPSFEICSFGMSKPTPEKGLKLHVIEVDGIESLLALPDDSVKGRIVFYNRKMNSENYSPFMSYGEIAAFRSTGVSEASKKGASAILARSSALTIDSFPHSGVMRYSEGIDSIPALSICTRDADRLSELHKSFPDDLLYIKTNCETFPDTTSYNVIGEIRGSEFPDEYIVVGGHIDCWDNSPGAHDDGGGCVQSMEIIRLFKKMNYTPLHTIRIVMFMDEEVAQRGGKKYAELSSLRNEKHVAAIESDRGVSTPFGFSADMPDSCFSSLTQMVNLLKPWGIWLCYKGGSGVDISPLKPQGVPLIAIVPDSQKYFEFHHCANDKIEKVNQRELQLGSAAIASLVYLIDKCGWRFKN